MVQTLSSRLRVLGAELGEGSARTLIACALSLGLLGAFFSVPYLPMVDLPQHAAQLSIWLHLDSPNFPEARLFELNLRTPYIGAYVLARVLAALIGVLPALKLAVWLSVVGHFLAFDLLLKKLAYPRWLGFLGLPLGLGYGFYFGFISFILALPLSLLSICAALQHRDRPTPRSFGLLAAALCATLASHGFAFGMALAVIGPLLLRGAGTFLARFAPVVAPALLAGVWLAPGSSAQSIGATIWQPRLLDLAQVPALLVAASAADRAACVCGALILFFVAATLGRPSRYPERCLPLLFMVLGYCLFPLMLGGFGPLHPRFAAFMVPTLLLAFEPRRAPRFAALPALVLGTTAVWLILFAIRLRAFARETQPILDFVASMPSGLHVRPIVFERTSQVFPALPALLHLPAYYAAEKAGLQGYSFAMYPTSVIRYVPGVVPTMTGGAEWQPESFSAADELADYDCFLVHSTVDRSRELFGVRRDELSLAFHERAWWAYRARSKQDAQAHEERKANEHG